MTKYVSPYLRENPSDFLMDADMTMEASTDEQMIQQDNLMLDAAAGSNGAAGYDANPRAPRKSNVYLYSKYNSAGEIARPLPRQPELNPEYKMRDDQQRNRITEHCVNFDTQNFDGQKSTYTSCYHTCKRMLDIIVSATGLVVLGGLFAIIAIAIKIDSRGPVFFAQQRTGYRGRRFKLIKFRTMIDGAHLQKDGLLGENRHGNNSVDFKIVNDPRTTRVGAFLRRLSLDELPNLWNVLKGELCLVGPRPTSFHCDRYSDQHLRRLATRPGVTGLWQISGRSELDFDQRVKLDMEYISKQNMLLDMQILLKTPYAIIKGRGAC